MALDWNTVTMDLQRSVNNLALFVLESMTPPNWTQTFFPDVDLTQPPPPPPPPPGYESMSRSSSDETMVHVHQKRPSVVKDKQPVVKKKKITESY